MSLQIHEAVALLKHFNLQPSFDIADRCGSFDAFLAAPEISPHYMRGYLGNAIGQSIQDAGGMAAAW